MPNEIFNESYFERGLEEGISCYQNYRWIPELTIPLAVRICEYLGIERGETILDYGCAKGYLVKAFRLIGRDAWGYDISDYAISNVDKDVEKYCVRSSLFPIHIFNWGIAKDVFEHISYGDISNILKNLNKQIENLFAIVPLGENNRYYSPLNDMDKTHLICENETWWKNFFEKSNWNIRDFTFKIEGIKDAYYKKTPKAHGFFTLKNKRKKR